MLVKNYANNPKLRVISSKQKDKAGVVLKIDGKNCHNLNNIAMFNTFFTTAAAKLLEKLSLPQMYFMLPLIFSNNFTVELCYQ